MVDNSGKVWRAAFNRATVLAVLSALLLGLTAYAKTRDVLTAVIIALGSIVTALGGRGVVEGAIDADRAKEHVVNDSDVAAYLPALPKPGSAVTNTPDGPKVAT